MTETGDVGGQIEGAPVFGATVDAEPFDVPAEADPFEVAEPPAATGHPAVDEVLASLESLADRPVAEHVAVFEQAHEQLRQALSQPATGDARA